MRVLAVRRVTEDGERPSAVRDSRGLCRTGIYPWRRRYKEEGLEALVEKISQGPEPKLRERQRPQVRRWIRDKDPRQHGFDCGLWPRRSVQTRILEKMGGALCLTAGGKRLASLEITPQKPLRRAYERDPGAVERWRREDYPKLRKRAQTLGAMIFFLAAAGFQSDPPLGRDLRIKRTHAGRGQFRPAPEQQCQPRGPGQRRLLGRTSTGQLDAETSVILLRDFRKGRRTKVFLVVEGQPAHKANVVQD